MEIFRLGNIKVIPYVFFLRDEMNDPVCLEDSFENLARVLLAFNEEKIQEQMGEGDTGHILDLYCIGLSNNAPFCKNYAKVYFYFDAKHLDGLSGQYRTLP